jgi:hypothetical protein
MTPVASLVADPFHDVVTDHSVDDAVDRLTEEFSDRLRPQLIVRVVRDCRRDLGGSPVGALPELVERLARIRLAEAVTR